MKLVDASTLPPPAPRTKVAVLVFDGVEIIDFTGPWEVFGAAGFEVYAVAESRTPVTTAMGLTVVPKYTFADAPLPDLLLVPGGGVKAARESAATLKWVTSTSARTARTMSVCNGAFILASAGLLDGLTATTTAGQIDRLRKEFPKAMVVDDRRFVDNGKIITTAGLSAGIDGALHVVEKILGRGQAESAALGIEYDWRPETGFARAALADRLIPEVGLDALGRWELVRTHGGTDGWEIIARGTSDLSAAELSDRVGRNLVQNGKWNPAPAQSGASGETTHWTFTGRDGRPWKGTLTIRQEAGRERRAILTIARAA
jgi:putative intracellular protease/amidase